jgi:hypothetical protein
MTSELQLRLDDKKRQFEEQYAALPQRRAELAELQRQLAAAEALLRTKEGAPGAPRNPQLYSAAFALRERVARLEREVERLESREDEIEFWLDLTELMRSQARPPLPPPPALHRCEIVHGGSDGESDDDDADDAWGGYSSEELDASEDAAPSAPSASASASSASASASANPGASAAAPAPKRRRGTLVEHFVDAKETKHQEAKRQMIDFISGKGVPSTVVSTLQQDQCPALDAEGRACGGDLVLDRDQYRCLRCSRVSALGYAKTPADRERTSYVAQYTYKKINHFKDWLSQFQAKENTVIPEEVLDQVRLALRQKGIKDLSKITPRRILRVLKEIPLPKMYEHKNLICNKISGNPPPFLSGEQERKLRDMFEELQAPFERHRPRNRKNFLSYSYTLHKLLQLLGLPRRIFGQFKILAGPQLVAIHDQAPLSFC